MLESIAQDVRFAIRALARSRGVTATAVFTLALGVAATVVRLATLLQAIPRESIRSSRSAWSSGCAESAAASLKVLRLR